MNNPLGVSPSKGKQGTTRGKEKIGTVLYHHGKVCCQTSGTIMTSEHIDKIVLLEGAAEVAEET